MDSVTWFLSQILMRRQRGRKGIRVFLDLLIIAAVLLLTGCHTPDTAKPDLFRNTSVQKDSPHMLIPEKVNRYLSVHFPAYLIAEKGDYINSWWSFYDTGMQPFVVKTDINDDSLADYGLVLKSADSIAVLILIGSGASFRPWFIRLPAEKPFVTQAIHFGLVPEPPGQIDIAYPRVKTLLLESNGINLMDFENRIAVCYWADHGVHLFLTGNLRIDIDEM